MKQIYQIKELKQRIHHPRTIHSVLLMMRPLIYFIKRNQVFINQNKYPAKMKQRHPLPANQSVLVQLTNHNKLNQQKIRVSLLFSNNSLLNLSLGLFNQIKEVNRILVAILLYHQQLAVEYRIKRKRYCLLNQNQMISFHFNSY